MESRLQAVAEHKPFIRGRLKAGLQPAHTLGLQLTAAVGKEEATQHWLEYSIDRYGKDWDT